VLKNSFWVVVENILEPVTGFIVLDTGRHLSGQAHGSNKHTV